ncbi:MAG: cobalt ECF transporter T component CbiQ [Aigarchaeota archaeon]|nr:cobalt ECF transporter T component CbiQ [Aigarchaeota archaeon]
MRSFLKTFEDTFYVEKYSASAGLLQSIDPRVKIISTFAIVVTAVAARTMISLSILLALVFGLAAAARIPLRFFLYRATVFVPLFAGIITLPLLFITPGTPLVEIGIRPYIAVITVEGIYKAAQFFLRVWVCVASLTLLILITRFSKVIQAMDRLRVPSLFVTLTSVTFRSIFVLVDEAYRMVVARESRSVGKESRMEVLRSLASMVGTLFIRSYERGERVYMAMLARGYSGQLESMDYAKLRTRDFVFGLVILSICLAIFLLDFLHMGVA